MLIIFRPNNSAETKVHQNVTASSEMKPNYQKNKNDYGRISLGHIIPFGNSQDSQNSQGIISFHFISLFHCDLSNPNVCKFIVNRQDYCD